MAGLGAVITVIVALLAASEPLAELRRVRREARAQEKFDPATWAPSPIGLGRLSIPNIVIGGAWRDTGKSASHSAERWNHHLVGRAKRAVTSMQIDWIVSLVAVVEHGGFSAAGEETHRSQSRISAHIASLERTLGAVLIDRRTRPVSLTDTGRAYFPHARSALDELRRGADDVAALTNQVSGTVVVGSSFSISAGYLAKVIAELRASHPAIVVEVVEGLAAPTIEELAAGNVDLAVLPGGFSEHEVNLRHQTLWDEPYVAVINQLHQLAGEGPIDPAELRGHPLLVIGRAGGEPDLEITTLLDSWDLRHQVHNPTESPQTLANLVKHGVGVGVINALAMQVSDTDGLSVRPFAGEQLRRTVAMWWDPQPYLNVAVRTVMDAIRDGAAPDLSDYGS